MSKGVLLVNLGSPDSPSVPDVRRYLNEFLMDGRVIDVAWPLRRLIVAMILINRPKESGHAYEKIWTKDGSPLVVTSKHVREALQKRVSVPVELAMRYQSPSIEFAVKNLAAKGVNEVLLIPLFPHYAMSSYETAVVRVQEIATKFASHMTVTVQPPYYNTPDFIAALVASAADFLKQDYDHLLFSYHGIPERHLRKSDPTGCHCLQMENCCEVASPAHATCYRAQCFATTAAFVKLSGVPKEKYSVSFQSRLGRDPWLKPYTDYELPRLAQEGKKRMLVICPAFVSDCLETIEEIGMRGCDQFLRASGKEFTRIPCMNAHPLWIQTLERMVQRFITLPNPAAKPTARGSQLLAQSKAKHAWSEIARAEPPKRSAAERVSDFREIYSLLDEETIRRQASRCLQCPEPLCQSGCPLHNRIPEWLSLAAAGEFLAAAEICATTSNMPEITSHVCPQERLCEGACILNSKSDPVCIGSIEKFVNEYALTHGGVKAEPAPPNGFRVAVIGSGPGGLACADELAQRGYAVTIFESLSLPGGLLVNGIPSFKLEKSIVERRVNLLRQRGVEFRLGVTVGKDISLRELRSDFHAVFFGIGAQRAKPLDIPGADLKGVIQALPFLIQMNVNVALETAPISVQGKRVAVLGGGDTAMDCLRTAVRSGAIDTVCLYRRDLENMPGNRKEYANALEEGARFSFLTNPIAIEGNAAGEVTQVRCVQMELGAPDANGRRKPRPVPNSEFVVPAEVVIAAYGFDPVPFPPASEFAEIDVNDWGAVEVDENQMTSVPGVFSGGDAVRGPSLVVHAVRDGRKAAAGIERYLSKKSLFKPAGSEARVPPG